MAWSGNLLFHDSALFSRAVAYSSLPPDVVVRCHWRGRPPSGLGARTEGLRALGLPELDYPPTGEDADTIDTKLKNVAAYLIAKGMVLNDGDTFSIGNNAPVNVKHTKDESGNMVLMLERSSIS
ncbi:DUF4261 domain-containing protein [Roseomonas sp. CAU 1739]|uniref:DUF4261 domain-containing protein n=1 Tax=Roseomonas sp. CAU 1739 TaxID=3140364 RepID=UPI0038CF442C